MKNGKDQLSHLVEKQKHAINKDLSCTECTDGLTPQNSMTKLIRQSSSSKDHCLPPPPPPPPIIRTLLYVLVSPMILSLNDWTVPFKTLTSIDSSTMESYSVKRYNYLYSPTCVRFHFSVM